MAKRILGMDDVFNLVEKVQTEFDEEKSLEAIMGGGPKGRISKSLYKQIAKKRTKKIKKEKMKH